MINQGGELDFQKFLDKLPGLPGAKYEPEKHVFGHNYTGPGTRLDIRLDEHDNPKPGEEPKNRVDLAAYHHDIGYRNNSDIETRHKLDRIMINELDNISNPTLAERFQRSIVKKALQAKLYVGGNFNKLSKKTQDFLNQYPANKRKLMVYALHKKANKVKTFRSVQCFFKDNIWIADLRVMPKDRSYKYILFVEDCFTRYAWLVPLKDKKGETIYNEFLNIIKSSGRRPYRLWTDQGKEFYNQHVHKLFKYHEKDRYVKDELGNFKNEHYSVFNQNKANLVERLIKTVNRKLDIHFTDIGKQEWVKGI